MSKEAVITFIVLWVLSAVVSGCVPIGATRFPQAPENFVPKKEYATSFEAAWANVHDVLNKNRIVVAAENRGEGRVTTEYIQGQSQADVLGLLGVISTRYRYSIRIARGANRNTTIDVVANLESSGNAMPAWRDISNDNTRIVTNIENWLYEQIQKRLSFDEY